MRNVNKTADQTHTRESHQGLPLPQRYWALLTITLGITVSVMDSSIANVALPTIARELDISPALSIWIVNGYQLALALCLLPFASLGEILGYRNVYIAGLAAFTVTSLICALADSFVTLAVARAAQGVAAAGIISVNTALVRFTHPGDRLGSAIGLNAVFVSTASAAGPTVASAILAVAPWPYLFAVNIPIGLLAVIVGWYSLPHTPKAIHRFDYPSAFLIAGTFGFYIISLDLYGHDTSGPVVLGLLGAAIIACLFLVRRQLRLTSPMLPLDLLRNPLFALSVVTSMCAFVGQMMTIVALPFHLQEDLHFGVVETGLMITPWPIATALVAPLAGRLADRYPAGLLGVVGLAIFVAGLALVATMPDGLGLWNVAWRVAVAGAGFGFFQTPNNRAIMSSAPTSRTGGAGGMLSMARMLGQTVGAALVALLFARFPQNGTIIALEVAIGFALAGALVSSLRLGPVARG